MAILCLIYGGIAFFMFVYLSYFAIERAEIPAQQLSNLSSYPFTRQRPRPMLLSLLLPLTLIGSVVSISAGILFIRLLREKENKEIKMEIIDSMVLPDERIVINELEKNHGTLTQSEIVSSTGLSKVKVHRIIKRLESLGILKKYPYGLTNKIKLEKSLHE